MGEVQNQHLNLTSFERLTALIAVENLEEEILFLRREVSSVKKKKKKRRNTKKEKKRIASMPSAAWAEQKQVDLAKQSREAEERKGSFGTFGSGMLGGGF